MGRKLHPLWQDAAMPKTLRTELVDGVFSIVLTRAAEYNTITPELRDELSAAIDEGDANEDARVMLLRAEGPAFCAGYGLDWSTEMQAQESGAERVWDSAADLRGISTFVDVYMKLFKAWKPTIAAVQGWCIAGGTDMVRGRAHRSVTRRRACGGPPPPRCGSTASVSSAPSATSSPATRSRRRKRLGWG
jgi:enoyl-CoA hydratase